MMPRSLLLVRPGSVYPEIRARFGDFDEWFLRAAGDGAGWIEVVDPSSSALPAPEAYGGVLVTGSHSAAYGGEPWMDELERFLRGAVERSVPLLGVCFGHQAIAAALGGRVVSNPRGQELGTVEVELTAAGREDPFFRGGPRRFLAQASHDDCVERLPEDAELLATNGHTEVQAFRVGDAVWGVQFHPEITVELMRALIRHQRDGNGDDELVGRVEPSPDAARVLRCFFDLVTGTAGGAQIRTLTPSPLGRGLG